MWALGVTGTYLGDYFGILMDNMVTGFPFNVTDAPMYYGSTMSFLGTAILFGKPAGILLTIEVLIVYVIALRFEDPFTASIYAKRAKAQKKAGTNGLTGGLLAISDGGCTGVIECNFTAIEIVDLVYNTR